MNAIKILIVEDELIISKQLSIYLKQRNYDVIGIPRSGEQALEIVENENPDIVLMDIDLDGELDGIETAAKIHETLIIPIIYLTKFNDNRTLDRVKDTLPATYLTKPYKNHDVRNAIEMAISSLSLLSHNKTNDVKVSLEIELNNQNKENDQVFLLKDRIFIRNNNSDFDRLMLDDIIYMESSNHSVIIYTPEGEIKVKLLLKQIMELLKDYPIIRIHRQTAVNAIYVMKVSQASIILEYPDKSQKTLPMSATFRQDAFANFNMLSR